MKTFTTLKLTSAAIIALGLSSGAALAGEGHKKDCKKHKTTAAATSTSTGYATPATAVAAATETAAKKSKMKMKVLSFDEAVELCTSKNVSNLQACIDKKTGKAKPAS